jgi:5'-phosphate synthase pdxT subunit
VIRVGVVAVQGDVTEHLEAARLALAKYGLEGEVLPVRRRPDLDRADCLAIPGGESTTISKLLQKFDLFDAIVARADSMPILGTCAGAILLASEGDEQVEKTETRLFHLMDMAVDRNAFGRQRESFEADLAVKGLETPVHGVFIRAPAITKVWGRCTALSILGEGIVLARQGHLIAAAFHPELSGEYRIHKMLFDSL